MIFVSVHYYLLPHNTMHAGWLSLESLWKDGNPCQQTRDVNPETHETRRPTNVGEKDDDRDRGRLVQFRLSLDRFDSLVEIGRHRHRQGEPHRSNEIVKDVKAGVDRQKALPLAGCERTQACLFGKAEPTNSLMLQKVPCSGVLASRQCRPLMRKVQNMFDYRQQQDDGRVLYSLRNTVILQEGALFQSNSLSFQTKQLRYSFSSR